MRKNSALFFTRHHIIPRSRGGSDDTKNIIMKTQREHRAYHILFGNRTPEEIIALLTSGKYQINEPNKWAAYRLLFDHMSPVEAAGIIKSEWTKDDSAFINLST